MSSTLMEWIKIGLSGFLLTLITSLITWFTTRKHYKKQIAHQIYIGPVLNELYKPLIEEYKRVQLGKINAGNAILDNKLIASVIRRNNVLLNTVPTKIRKKLEYIERLSLSNTDINKFETKSDKILIELKSLNDELARIYKEFVYE